MGKVYKKLSLWFLLLFTILALGIIIKYKSFYMETMKGMHCKDKLNVEMYFKGFKKAVDFTYDNKGTYFIAYKDKIQVLNEKGYSDILFKNSKLNITNIEYEKGNLFYVSEGKVYLYDIKNKKEEIIIKDIPNYGDYKNTRLRVFGPYLYVAIGSATNSGVVGEDNLWVDEHAHNCDVSPKPITVKGQILKNHNTGAFVPYNTKNINNQIINNNIIGNSSIIIYNRKSKNVETFAWGIRNVKDFNFNSEGKIFALVGGMENRGARPVFGDVDYIYNINKGLWYGWPDYSGGDPLNSPRFRNDKGKTQELLLVNPPSTNPPAPFYQHKSLNALVCMDIDVLGILGEKNSIFFYEEKENKLYCLNKNKVLKEEVQFPKNSKICSIKFCEDSIILLDSIKGIMYKISRI